jgi:nitrogen fixation/metabolism regulation signal transduction histidine kinase
MLSSTPRRLAIATAAVFLISLVFPIVAGFVKNTNAWPKWWGTIDVGVAFVLALLVLLGQVVARDKVDQNVQEDASYRAYRLLVHVLLAILIVFFVTGDRIIWNQCLTGFAWRSWLLGYGLPWWLAAWIQSR